MSSSQETRELEEGLKQQPEEEQNYSEDNSGGFNWRFPIIGLVVGILIITVLSNVSLKAINRNLENRLYASQATARSYRSQNQGLWIELEDQRELVSRYFDEAVNAKIWIHNQKFLVEIQAGSVDVPLIKKWLINNDILPDKLVSIGSAMHYTCVLNGEQLSDLLELKKEKTLDTKVVIIQ